MNSVDELNLLLGIGPARPQLPVTLRKSGYVPVRALGKGSYGQALLVFHEPRQQYFVVKHLNLAGMSSRQRHDAHNEISILQKLHHPNIVQYVEYYEEHPHLYIIMEYADGGDVYSLLSSAQAARKAGARAYRGLGPAPAQPAATGLLTEAQVVSLFVQTTMAVKYMHDRRLLHRDIKSSNIFLTKNHIVKLGDFGISTVLQSTMAMASTMCGTPCYFSPELCQGRPYNNKSDMWALGVLLYELCAGHVPFESTTMKTLMRDIVHKQPPRIPAVYSEPLWELIVQLLHKDPRRRPDAGQVLMAPALMKYVPELIDQLAADPAYAAATRKTDDAQQLDSSNSDSNSHAVVSHPNGMNKQGEGRGGIYSRHGPAGDAAGHPQKNASNPAAVAAVAAAPPASPPPPPPPPRHYPERSASQPQAVAPPSAAAPAAGPKQQPPSSPSRVPVAGKGPSDQVTELRAAKPSASPSPSPNPQRIPHDQKPAPSQEPASIASLLARFDAQKQQLAENKLKKSDHHQQQQQQQQQKQPHKDIAERKQSSGNHDDDSRDPSLYPQLNQKYPSNGVAHLSPGAVAALRQQGYDAEGDSQIFSAAGRLDKPNALPAVQPAGQRRSFAPPPLPAALRNSSNAAVAAVAAAAAVAPTTQKSSISADTAMSASENPRQAHQAGKLADARSDDQRPDGEPPRGNVENGMSAAVAHVPLTGSTELGAVLSELSSWRERSLRRQRRHQDETSVATPSAEGEESGRKPAGGARDGGRASHEKYALPTVTPHPPRPAAVASLSSPAENTVTSSSHGARPATPDSKASSDAEVTRRPMNAALHNSEVAMVTSTLSLTAAPKGKNGNTSAAAAGAPEVASPPPPPPPSQSPHAPSPRSSSGTQLKDTSQKIVASSAAHPSPSSPTRNANATSADDKNDKFNNGSRRSSGNAEDELSESNAQSFVDAMGTTIDVGALQETSRASSLTPSSGRHGHQQSMHKSFRGTSEKIDALRATLPAGSVRVHATASSSSTSQSKGKRVSDAAAAARTSDAQVERSDVTTTQPREHDDAADCTAHEDADADEGDVDMNFTTSCLCGGAVTHQGCLSMIYGSFICACDVCVRFTGAAQGVEWLHLPQVEGLEMLLPLTSAGEPTPVRDTTAKIGGNTNMKNNKNSRSSKDAQSLSCSSPHSPSAAPRGPSAGGGAVAAASIRAQAAAGAEPTTTHGGVAAHPQTAGAPPLTAASDTRLSDSTTGAAPHSPFASPKSTEMASLVSDAVRRQLQHAGVRAYVHQPPLSSLSKDGCVEDRDRRGDEMHSPSSAEAYVLYSCFTCGSLVGMRHDGVEGLLLPKATLDEQSLRILSSCAQTVVVDGDEGEEGDELIA